MGSKPKAAAPAPIAAPIAPPAATSVEVTNATRQQRLGASLRRGLGQRSIRAGETFSGTSYQSQAGVTRLLGGGG